MSIRLTLSALVLAAAPGALFAQAMPEGYLCCSMRTDGKWISDGNYAEVGKRILPPGTPVKVLGYGRYRVLAKVEGADQVLGNDYSRNIPLEAFAQRYVVAVNPQTRISTFEPRVREAIRTAKLFPGMTREQVLMAVGYPISSETPTLEVPVWRYWLNTSEEFQVVFNAQGVVTEVGALPLSRSKRLME